MLIGYVHVFTQAWSLELQREAIVRVEGQKVFEHKLSSIRADRPSLTKALEMLQ